MGRQELARQVLISAIREVVEAMGDPATISRRAVAALEDFVKSLVEPETPAQEWVRANPPSPSKAKEQGDKLEAALKQSTESLLQRVGVAPVSVYVRGDRLKALARAWGDWREGRLGILAGTSEDLDQAIAALLRREAVPMSGEAPAPAADKPKVEGVPGDQEAGHGTQDEARAVEADEVDEAHTPSIVSGRPTRKGNRPALQILKDIADLLEAPLALEDVVAKNRQLQADLKAAEEALLRVPDGERRLRDLQEERKKERGE